MDFQVIVNALTTVGFPIVAFFVSVYALKYSYDKSLEQNNNFLEQLAEITKAQYEMASAINNNTEILTRLVDKSEVIMGE